MESAGHVHALMSAALAAAAVSVCVCHLQGLWNRPELRDDLQRSFKGYKRAQPVQTDVMHSRAFEQYCGDFVRGPGYRNVVLMLYADGVSVATRRDSSMFVISAQVVNLPPDKRRLVDNILLLQIIPGPKTPSNISGLLRPLVDELRELYTMGVRIDIGNGERITIKAMFITIVADCRAHPKLTMMMQTPAEYPCHLCKCKVSTLAHSACAHTLHPHTQGDRVQPAHVSVGR